MDKTLKQNAKQHSDLKSFFAQSQSVLLIYSMAAKAIVIVVGVGPGTGSAIARKFGAAYPIALLARKQESYEGLVKEINEKGGKAIGFNTDVSSEASVKAAFRKIHDEYGIAPVAAAIFNAPGIFLKKPLLDMSVDEFGASWQVSW